MTKAEEMRYLEDNITKKVFLGSYFICAAAFYSSSAKDGVNRVSKSFGRHLDSCDKTVDKNVNLIRRMVYKHKCEVKYH